METRDPARWLDEPGGLAPELREALAAYAASGPTAEQQARMFAAIEPVGAGAALSPAQRLVSAWKTKLIGLAALTLAGGAFLASGERAPKEVAAVWAPAAPVPAPAPFVPAPAPSVPAPAPSAPPPPRVVEPGAAAKVAERSKHPPRVTAPPREAASLEVTADPVAELALLSRARRVLLASPPRALELTDEHARRYPRGALSEEREVLAIEALVRAGRAAEARDRRDAFARARPRSAHLARLEVILEGG